jgi:hypothetical protein
MLQQKKLYILTEDLVDALGGQLALLRPHQYVDLVEAVARAEQLLDERLAQEAGRARHKYRLVLVVFGDEAQIFQRIHNLLL